jgi:hypothetical protein
MTWTGQILKTVLAVGAALLAISSMAKAEFIYDIEGAFAPSFVNEDTPTFEGQFTFPEDDVSNLEGIVQLSNEELPREFNATMSLNLPGTPFQPWDTRLYAGLFGEEVMTMLLVDYDQEAGSNLLASQLNNGGGWDGWNISFINYPVGSVSAMEAVNEPAAWALAVFGFVVVFGLIRGASLNH